MKSSTKKLLNKTNSKTYKWKTGNKNSLLEKPSFFSKKKQINKHIKWKLMSDQLVFILEQNKYLDSRFYITL